MKKGGRDVTVYFLGLMQAHMKSESLLTYLYELENSDALISDFESAVKGIEGFTQSFSSVHVFRLYRIYLYALIRSLNPKTVIETGVLHGMTTAFLLEALEKNGGGTLHSVDLPSYFESGPANNDGIDAVLPKGKEPGWIVPERLHQNWKLHKGASTKVLPELALQAGELDLFIHDSDHTYENMYFELKYGWGKLREGGVLICDNIVMNTAFSDFCYNIERLPILIPAPDEEIDPRVQFGFLVK